MKFNSKLLAATSLVVGGLSFVQPAVAANNPYPLKPSYIAAEMALKCLRETLADDIICDAYLDALIDTTTVFDTFCLPISIGRKKLKKEYTAFVIDRQDEVGGLPAARAFYLMMQFMYPCQR